jgi:hypothetical protein
VSATAGVVLRDLAQTSSRCPSQWEGVTDSGKPVYIRYRHGRLTVQFGPVGGDVDDALGAAYAFRDQVVPDGAPNDGYMDVAEMLERTGMQLEDWSEA